MYTTNLSARFDLSELEQTTICQGFRVINSPNSALHLGHVTWATGWALRDKCLDKLSCISMDWLIPGLHVTVK